MDAYGKIQFRNTDLNQISDNHERQREDQKFQDSMNAYQVEEAVGGSSPARKLPVKQHISVLQKELDTMRKEIHTNRKIIQETTNSLNQIENSSRESCSEVVKYISTELDQLGDDLSKVINVEKQETAFLRNQIVELNQDKVKLQQNTVLLSTRVEDVEQTVGIDL